MLQHRLPPTVNEHALHEGELLRTHNPNPFDRLPTKVLLLIAL